MIDIQQILDNADLVVNGYAFTKCSIGYRVLNTHNTLNAMVISFNGEPLESTMNDIEMKIVSDYFNKNKHFLDD